MNVDTIKKNYPKLFSRLEDEIDTLRDIVVIDDNEHDDEVDELEDIDSGDYNYIVYIPETLQEVLENEKNLIALVRRLEGEEAFDDFLISEIDLYGVRTELDESGIAGIVLGSVEEILG